MPEIGDIFQVWDTLVEMARDIDTPYYTVAKWHQRKRIPAASWPAVIDAAAKRGKKISATQLMRANARRAESRPSA